MAAEPADFKFEVYKVLRDEITHHIQAMSALLGVALTATAAIGAFALNKQTGDRQALLVLPFVLSGLALVQVNHGIQIRRLGEYIRTHVWPSHGAAAVTSSKPPMPSWEEWIADIRIERSFLKNPAKAAYFAGNVVVFAMPSIGALLITRPEAWQATWVGVVWGFAVFVVLAATAIAVLVEQELAASDERPSRSPPPRSGD
ncbi:MAG: hypothetical protein WAU42_01130 [Solirubrobacteraceae bacterium]